MFWRIKSTAPKEFIEQFPEYSPVTLELLYHRELKTQAQIDEFFNPDYDGDLHDPFLMLGMSEAVARVAEAINNKEPIAIFGDYDADGVCGAVLLKATLEALGADVAGGIYVPDRAREGYGLNPEAIKKIAANGVKLLITVDCGISENEDIDLAGSLGLEVIVTDHHQPGKVLPRALAIVNPWQAGDKYPFKELAGVGVAFKLAQALRQAQGKLGLEKKIPEGWEKWLLDLVALGTVADCMELLGENRTLVRYGLIVLAQTQRVGLQELMKVARLNPIYEEEKLKTNLDTYSLGFVLAPRLNAAGRIDHADLAVELLLTQDRSRAQEMARQINDYNRQRQKITDDIVLEIERRIKDKPSDKSNPVIIASEANWSPGVIGLVAGKIADRHNRPTFIFSAAGENEPGHLRGSATYKAELLRGSARSVEGFNLIEAIGQCEKLLIGFGGHIGAAGLEMLATNLPAFEKKINQIAAKKLKNKDLTPVLEIDAELTPVDIDWKLFDDLEKFEPFGKANERPLWLIKNLTVASVRVVGNGSKHLKLELKSEQMLGKIFKGIGFGLAGPEKNGVKNGNANLAYGDIIDIVAEIIMDEWNGTRNLQLKIVDLKRSG
ncbi:single-stranded-DNA-specific exonuclease RecJ [Patescibacteria group bacterium]|nr:single-stranded-DNA-specific exonuclease RecJ [Patescibacteria group bacterium]